MSTSNAKATVAAVQATYVLMDREATLDEDRNLIEEAAADGAQLVAFPEAFIPGTPIWIDSRPIWDGDERGTHSSSTRLSSFRGRRSMHSPTPHVRPASTW